MSYVVTECPECGRPHGIKAVPRRAERPAVGENRRRGARLVVGTTSQPVADGVQRRPANPG